jgi:ubiquinone/menaquinone biosynthesis C-methylase UbiE
MKDRRFHGHPRDLRSPERLERLEVGRVVDLCLEGITAVSVLDAGAGSGIFAEAFAARGLVVAGIDVNPEMVALARRYVPQADLRVAPLEAVPFDDEAFDLVFMGHVLHEADDPVKALREARRVARQRVAVLEWPHEPARSGPPLAQRLSSEAVANLAAQAGLAKLDITPLSHMVLYRLNARQGQR